MMPCEEIFLVFPSAVAYCSDDFNIVKVCHYDMPIQVVVALRLQLAYLSSGLPQYFTNERCCIRIKMMLFRHMC